LLSLERSRMRLARSANVPRPGRVVIPGRRGYGRGRAAQREVQGEKPWGESPQAFDSQRRLVMNPYRPQAFDSQRRLVMNPYRPQAFDSQRRLVMNPYRPRGFDSKKETRYANLVPNRSGPFFFSPNP